MNIFKLILIFTSRELHQHVDIMELQYVETYIHKPDLTVSDPNQNWANGDR
jgi:hypothetical protein